MTTVPFKPLGEFSRAEIVFRALRDRPDEELIPYSELPFDKAISYNLREQVSKRFEREQQRTLVLVRGLGWKLVRGAKQVDVASRKRRLATRKLGRAVQVIKTTDRREMSAQERVRADQELIASTTAYNVASGLARTSPKLGVEDILDWQRQHK